MCLYHGARRRLASKNALARADSRLVKAGFRAKVVGSGKGRRATRGGRPLTEPSSDITGQDHSGGHLTSAAFESAADS